jgi:hypothetical protein
MGFGLARYRTLKKPNASFQEPNNTSKCNLLDWIWARGNNLTRKSQSTILRAQPRGLGSTANCTSLDSQMK